MASKKSNRRMPSESPISIIESPRDSFFTTPLPADFTPETGDPSQANQPYFGEDRKPATAKIENRANYIKMSESVGTKSKSSKEKSTTRCNCDCCRRIKRSTEPKRVDGRKESYKPSRQMDSMAIEAEKLGRQLAMAGSMFAAGYAYGCMTTKWQEPIEEDEEEDGDQ